MNLLFFTTQRCPLLVLAAAFLLSSCVSTPRLPQPSVVAEPHQAMVPPTSQPVDMSDLNDTACYLAGLPGGRVSAFRYLRETPLWQEHQRGMDALWRQYSTFRQPRIDSFANASMGGLRGQRTLFYPFSGPDVLFASAFFPSCTKFVLVGLEGAEMLPDWKALSEQECTAALEGIEKSITTALNCSYFITKEMRTDLKSTRFQGTLPIVLVFLARLGADLQGVEPVCLKPNGELCIGTADGACPGYQVTFRAGVSTRQLYYFQENLANDNLRNDPRLLKFVRGCGAYGTYLKSASYLMHTEGFSVIRNAILNESQMVLQDDSGIPLRHFQQAGWQVDIFGEYGVIDLFDEYYQPDLANAVQQQGQRDIDFGIGYMFQSGNSCLLLGRNRR